jgi:hypothetical protein
VTTRDKRGVRWWALVGALIRGICIQRLRPFKSNGLEPLDADPPLGFFSFSYLSILT